MKFQRFGLLVKHTFTGFLAGTILIMLTLALHKMLDEPESFSVVLKRNPSILFLLVSPFILSTVFHLLGMSKLELLKISKKLEEDELERQTLLKELSDYKLALDRCAIITVIDTKGKIKRVNNNFIELTGCSSQYLLGRSILRLPSSLQHHKVFQQIKDQVEDGNVWKGEIVYYSPDGDTKYTSGIVMPLSQNEGANRDCLVIQYDITAEKKSNIALQKSESEKDVILSNTQTLICTHDLEGKLTGINKAGADIFKTTAAVLTGEYLGAMIDQRFVNEFDNYLQTIRSKRSAEGLMKIIAKDGSKRTLFYRNIINGHDGEEYIIGSAIDITETLCAQKEAEDQRAFTRQIIDISPNIICVKDAENNIILSNKRFKKIFHCAEENMNISGFTEESAQQLSVLLNHANPADISPLSNYECSLNDTDTASLKRYNVFRTEFTEQSGKSLVLFIGNDISERHHARLELVKAHSIMENALKVKEQFIANMSHEIRTPLNAIIGFTDVLTETQLDFQQKDYVQTVRIAGQNLLGIVNDILDLSKIEAGMIILEKKAIHLPVLVNNVKKLFEPKVAEKGLTLILNVAADVPAFVTGDAGRLNQVLINLVSNAVKFTHKGEVKITVEKTAGDDNTKIYLRFAVSDSGIGISADKKMQIFDRFAQESEHTHRMYGGTGLGLNISKNLVEMFGGTIHFESEQGRGTTFEFTIPFEIADSQIQAEALPEMQPGNARFARPVKILLAEDNKTNARLAKQILTKQGFDITHVMDGLDVIEALDKKPYDLILMDIQMGVQDGIETTKIIRSGNKNYCTIPIIALTAHSFAGEKNICTEAGMNGYISKPFSPQQLYNAINKILIEKEINILVESIA